MSEAEVARKFLKAEILFTRHCDLSCAYCGMKREGMDEMDMDLWWTGLCNIAMLGCEFCAIYGAEPLTRFDRLEQFLYMCVRLDLRNTVITNGLGLTEEKFRRLWHSGLRSITVSCDSLSGSGVGKDSDVARKSEQGLETLTLLSKLREKLPLRDLEAIVTITRRNIAEFPAMVRYFTERNIWTSFDFIHTDRGMKGSKCPPAEQIADLLFTDEDIPQVREVFEEVLVLKRGGALLHQTEDILSMAQDPKYYREYCWNCAYPGWISVECDGSLLCCDDRPDDAVGTFKIWELANRWEEFVEVWGKAVRRCAGCFWSTHVMSERMVAQPKAGEYFCHEG